jgi:hypothetical protein
MKNNIAAIMYRQGIDPGARAASNSRPSLNRRASAPVIDVTDASLSFNLRWNMRDFEELAQLLGAEEEAIYQEMRRKVMHEIASQEMAVTVIMRDLIEIRRRSPRHADIIEYAVASPFCSYEELARIGEVSKQAIFSQMRKYARSYPWIAGLIRIRSIQNTRGVPDPESRKRIRKVLDTPVQPEFQLDGLSGSDG